MHLPSANPGHAAALAARQATSITSDIQPSAGLAPALKQFLDQDAVTAVMQALQLNRSSALQYGISSMW